MRAQLYNSRTGEHRVGGEESIPQWHADPDSVLWADYETVSPQQRAQQLEGVFGLHPLAVEDALRDRHPPKCEHFDEHLFVRLRGLDSQTEDIEFRTIDISLFFTNRLLVTRRTGHSVNTEALWQELTQSPGPIARIDYLAVSLIGRVVQRYVTILLDFEPRLDQLERRLFKEQGDELLVELTGYKTRLKQLRRIFQYHVIVLDTLLSLFKDKEQAELRHSIADAHDQAGRSLSLSVLYYELIADLVDAYLALSSHRLNQVMRVLTIVTVIFIPLSLLAGIYGMNFEHIPELKATYGYYTLLGSMVLVIAVQLLYFKRKGWIWSG